jgi:glycosyltransferase involved in cell wall biosynthesis
MISSGIMRILFLSPRQAVPSLSGAKLREYHFLRALGSSSDLTYLYFSDPGAEPLTVKDLPFCRDVIAIPKPPTYGLGKTIQGAFSRWPLPILNYTSAEMSAATAKVLSSTDFDIIHLDSIHMIRYAPAARSIFNWHNIESEAMQRYSASTSSAARRWYARLTAKKLSSLERGILKSAFGHIVCSEREREQLRQIAPGARIAVVGNGVDTSYFASGERASGERAPGDDPRPRVVFVGAMDYSPNSEGAIFFATEIWPHIQRRLGNPELTIVGANPGPAVRALGELPGVTVTGTVADVRPFYLDALAAVVPLRSGGGTRLKILEAMAAGVPVISTPLGAEGLDVRDGENIMIVDAADITGWVDRIGILAESPEHRARLTGAALRLVETRYDWRILGAKLVETYRNWLGG